jgi:hypothetical protein
MLSLTRFREYFSTECLDPTEYLDPKSIKTMMLMPAEHFIKLALPTKGGDLHEEKIRRTGEWAGMWHALPYLKIKIDRNSREAVVTGHEGRHRIVYMEEHDVRLVPVVFWCDIKRGSDELRWGTSHYRPRILVSQNKRIHFPFPDSIVFPHPRPHPVDHSSAEQQIPTSKSWESPLTEELSRVMFRTNNRLSTK